MDEKVAKVNDRELAGRRIAIPETREIELFAGMLADLGAEVLRCPLVAILDNPDTAEVLAWIDEIHQTPLDLLILLTGEGLRRLVGFADRAQVREQFIADLSNVKTLVRGPKPSKALREIGLTPTYSATVPTTAGIIESLIGLPIEGQQIGVQLYGSDPNLPLRSFLESKKAISRPVSPYIYASKSAGDEVENLINQMSAGRLDAIAFTSASQVDRLEEVAKDRHLTEALRIGLQNVLVAAVGPVVALRLERIGVSPTVMPERTFFLRPLVNELVEKLHQP